jgi:hypothetical protein
MNGDQLRDEWFHRPSGSPSPPEWSSAPPPARPAGDPLWSTVTGGVGGLIGATAVVFMRGIDPRVHPATGVAAAIAGALLGGLFGRVTRRLVRVIPRIALGAIFASVIWLALYSFVIVSFVPWWTTTAPLAPSIVDALVFGACVGLLPPARVRSERGRRA